MIEAARLYLSLTGCYEAGVGGVGESRFWSYFLVGFRLRSLQVKVKIIISPRSGEHFDINSYCWLFQQNRVGEEFGFSNRKDNVNTTKCLAYLQIVHSCHHAVLGSRTLFNLLHQLKNNLFNRIYSYSVIVRCTRVKWTQKTMIETQ